MNPLIEFQKKAIDNSTKEIYKNQAEELKKTLLEFCPDGQNKLFKKVEYTLVENKKNSIIKHYEVTWTADINSSSYNNKDGCFCIEAFINGGLIKDSNDNMIEIGPNRNNGLIPSRGRS